MNLQLTGLTPAPSQVCGAIRLVPLLRETPCDDLRLGLHPHGQSVVHLPDKTSYWAFMPHGLILDWSPQGQALVSTGGQLGPGTKTQWSTKPLPKMRKKEGKNALRFLPLHLALEGFLALHFGGPEIAWDAYRRSAFDGLQSSSERVVYGRGIYGLEEALRVFEIHEGQVGVLVFVAETLASAFVCPRPEDYRPLHTTLLEDFYGTLIAQYAAWYDTTSPLDATLQTEGVGDLAGLRSALAALRARWAEFTRTGLAGDLLGQELHTQPVYQAGPFALSRFITKLDGHSPGHIGEQVLREDGEVLYLKTFRLSVEAVRRAYVLSKVAEHAWNLDDTAKALGCDTPALILRLERAGFGGLLRPDVLAKAHKAAGTLRP